MCPDYVVITCFKMLSMSNKGVMSGKKVVLRLEPGTGNPGNSEGDFITLKNVETVGLTIGNCITQR